MAKKRKRPESAETQKLAGIGVRVNDTVYVVDYERLTGDHLRRMHVEVGLTLPELEQLPLDAGTAAVVAWLALVSAGQPARFSLVGAQITAADDIAALTPEGVAVAVKAARVA